MKVYALTAQGLAVKDQLILRSLLRISEAACAYRWTFTEEIVDSDAVVIGPYEQSPTLLEHRRPIAIYASALRGSEHPPRRRIQLPLRISEVTSMLIALTQEFDQPDVPRGSPPSQEKKSSLRLRDLITLVRNMKPSKSGTLRSIMIEPSILVRFHAKDRQIFWSTEGNLPIRSLLQYVRNGAAVVQILDDQSSSWSQDQIRPLSELLWALASVDTDPEALFDQEPGKTFQFSSWPPIDPGACLAIDMRLAAALVRRPNSWPELVEISGSTESDIVRVLNAGMQCQLLKVGAHKSRGILNFAASVPPLQKKAEEAVKRRLWIVQVLRTAIRLESP